MMFEELLMLMNQRGAADAAMIAGILWIAFARPSRIRSLMLYRFAVLLFCASLVMPVMNRIVLLVLNQSGGGGGRFGGPADIESIVLMIIPIVLFALSLFCLAESIRPRMTDVERPETMPPRAQPTADNRTEISAT